MPLTVSHHLCYICSSGSLVPHTQFLVDYFPSGVSAFLIHWTQRSHTTVYSSLCHHVTWQAESESHGSNHHQIFFLIIFLSVITLTGRHIPFLLTRSYSGFKMQCKWSCPHSFYKAAPSICLFLALDWDAVLPGLLSYVPVRSILAHFLCHRCPEDKQDSVTSSTIRKSSY